MKHKVSELEGALLDAAVATAEGIEVISHGHGHARWSQDYGRWRGWNPSSDWRDGGPLVERERIAIAWKPSEWMASTWRDHVHYQGHIIERGPTPLIAAMRAYVTSRFGEEVELP